MTRESGNAGADWGTPVEREGFRLAYEALARIVDPADIEPFRVVEAVERHRRVWQPERTRTLLLAESHVWTSDEECARMVWAGDFAGISSRSGRTLGELPRNFVRLVYCLGYGESQSASLEGSVALPSTGTPQFWKLFWACCHPVEANEDFAPILKGQCRDARRRLKNKLDLLEAMKQAGVWLMDASIIGLYESGQKSGRKKQMKKVIPRTWENYTSKVLEVLQPECVIVIGKGVYKLLEPQLKNCGRRMGFETHAIHQPQAQKVSAVEWMNHYRLLYQNCH